MHTKASKPPPAADRPGSRRRRILVVDDQADTANLLSMALTRAGHHVELAFGGLEAVDAAGRFRPEVVFLDLAMPGIDGFEVARRLRFLPGLSRIRLAALTGLNDPMSRAAASAAGFDHYLVKPPALAELFAVLEDRTVAAEASV